MKMVQTSACDGRKTKWSNEMRQIKNLPGNVLGFCEALRAGAPIDSGEGGNARRSIELYREIVQRN